MELEKPVNDRYYDPQEPIPRYPLELSKDLHVNLWSEDGKFKWSIAIFENTKEGPGVVFVGDRPFSERVNWEHFEELLRHGQLLADVRFFKHGEKQ